jgi:hypothetical protein
MKKLMMFAVAICAVACSLSAAEGLSGAKSYQIRNCKYDQLLRPRDANNSDGTRIVLYPAQPWKCMTWKFLPAGDTTFQLQNHFTQKTFEAKTNEAGTALVQIPLNRDLAKRPAWKLEKLSDGFYRITDVASGKCLSASAKDAVTLAAPGEQREQEWELIETDPSKLTM